MLVRGNQSTKSGSNQTTDPWECSIVVTRERIETTRSHLVSLLAYLTDDQLNWKPDANSWSISQVVQHISLVEGRAPDIIQLGLAVEPTFVPGNLHLDQQVTDRSIKRTAPLELHPCNDPKTLAELQHILEQSHQKFLDTFDRVKDDSRLDVTSPPRKHLVFGEMSTRQWIEAAHYHEMRHTLQIDELIGLLKGK